MQTGCKSPTKGSPTKRSPTKKRAVPKKIGVAHILRIVNEVYGNRVTVASAGQEQTIPLQQKLAMCTLLLMLKQGRGKEVTLGKVSSSCVYYLYDKLEFNLVLW